MKYTKKSLKLDNGIVIKYKIYNGTAYHAETSDEVVMILDNALSQTRKKRLKISYGDPKTGKPWGDVNMCYIGRSTGDYKIPLVVKTRSSLGGVGLLDHCIVKIEYANKRKDGTAILYQAKTK